MFRSKNNSSIQQIETDTFYRGFPAPRQGSIQRMENFIKDLTTSPTVAVRKMRSVPQSKGKSPVLKRELQFTSQLESSLNNLGQRHDSIPFLTSKRSAVIYDPNQWNIKEYGDAAKRKNRIPVA